MSGERFTPVEGKCLLVGLIAGAFLGVLIVGFSMQETDGERWDHCRAFIRAHQEE